MFYNYAAPLALAAGHRLNREPHEIREQIQNGIFPFAWLAYFAVKNISAPNPNRIPSNAPVYGSDGAFGTASEAGSEIERLEVGPVKGLDTQTQTTKPRLTI